MHEIGSNPASQKAKIQRLSINMKGSCVLVGLGFESIKDCWRREKGYFELFKVKKRKT